MRRTALAAALLLGFARLALAGATQGGTLGVPIPLFPADNWWNTDISQAPIDAKSSAFITHIGATRTLHPDFGGCVDTPCLDQIYGFPYVVVTGVQPADLRTVQFQYAGESDGVIHTPTSDTPYPFYPIPDAAITGAHWIESGEPGEQDPGGDRHMLIVDKDHNTLYELFALHWDGSQWTAGSGAFFDMNTNDRRPEGWTSADAAGLAILPGLVRYDEVYGPDPIRHAFRVTVQNSNGYVYPGSHDAGSTFGALPMGARLRLKSTKDISAFPPEMQKIFQAMKTYGLIVADNGSNMYISGTFDTQWDNDILNPAFGALKAGDFEVVKLGWQPPTSGLSVADATPVTEGNTGTTPATFTVTLTPAATQTVTVKYATVPGAATASVDYVSKTGTLVFLPGVTTRDVSVAVRGDQLHELDETFGLVLSAPVNAFITTGTAMATILDDDPPPNISITDSIGPEGDAGVSNRLFSVTLATKNGAPATVAYATQDGTATAGSDYVPTSGTLTFAPGVLKQVIAVPVLGDLANEPDETFSVVLSNATEAVLLDATATGTIVNDDVLPALVIDDTTVTEGSGGTTAATLNVTLSPVSSQVVTVRYGTAAGTAAAASDYVSKSGVLTFAAGTTNATVTVSIVPDTRVEKNEAFLVKLSSPKGAKLARAAGQVAILDDDGVADPCQPVLALPITLATPGTYCLARSLSTAIRSGAAITLAADGISLDLKGFSLAGSGGLRTTAAGIDSNGHKNLTITNGIVRGFLTGVRLRQTGPYSSPQGLIVQGIKALLNTSSGIWVEGLGSTVSGCTTSSTGRSTAFGPDLNVIGIAAVGPSPQITGNTATGNYGVGRGGGFGIALSGGDNALVSTNSVSATQLRATTGVFVDASASVAVITNTLSKLRFGIAFADGATGTATGNVFTHVTNPQVGP